MTEDFLWGVAAALVIGILFSYINRLYQGWIRDAGAADRKQVVVHVTDKTPAQVWRQSMRAKLRLALFWIWLITVPPLVYIYLFQPETWDFVKQFVRTIYEELING